MLGLKDAGKNMHMGSCFSRTGIIGENINIYVLHAQFQIHVNHNIKQLGYITVKM